MATPLPPSADGWLRFALLTGAGVAVAVVGSLMVWVRSPPSTGVGRVVAQPIELDHRHHTLDDGVDCLYCHDQARRSPYAGVPSVELCMGCHAQVWSRSTETLALRRAWARGAPVRWRRVHDLPDFVFFDHRAHHEGGVGCESCHGRVDHMARVYQTASLRMSWCLDCHRDPLPHLRARADLTRMGVEPSRERGTRIAAERGGVAPPTHCSGCHR